MSLHAVAADGVEVRAAHDEGDVLAGQRELRADVAADGAGADDWQSSCRVLRQLNLFAALSEAVAELADAVDLDLDGLPGFIEPTPTEVPHRMTSPG